MQIDPRLRGAFIPPLVIKSKLNTFERMMIGVLIMHGEVCFPSRETIAQEMGCSLGGVRKTMQSLESSGWLTVERRRGKRGWQTSSRYRLWIPDSAAPTGPQSAAPTGPQAGPHRAATTLNLNQNPNEIEKEEAEAAPKPDAAPAVSPSGLTASQAAERLLREAENIIREETNTPNAVDFAAGNRIVVGALMKCGWREHPEAAYREVDSLMDDDIWFFMDHKAAWTVQGFAGRYQRSRIYRAFRRQEARHEAVKREENRIREVIPGNNLHTPRPALHPLPRRV